MFKIFFILLLTSVCVWEVYCGPTQTGNTRCYEHECPDRTSACKRVIQTSADKKLLLTTISCLDNQNMELKNYNESEDNPYGEYVQYKSTSYSGTYTFQSHGQSNPSDFSTDSNNYDLNNNNNYNNNNYNGLEDLS